MLIELIGSGLYFLVEGSLTLLLLQEKDESQGWAIALGIGLVWPLVVITKLWDKFLEW